MPYNSFAVRLAYICVIFFFFTFFSRAVMEQSFQKLSSQLVQMVFRNAVFSIACFLPLNRQKWAHMVVLGSKPFHTSSIIQAECREGSLDDHWQKLVIILVLLFIFCWLFFSFSIIADPWAAKCRLQPRVNLWKELWWVAAINNTRFYQLLKSRYNKWTL